MGNVNYAYANLVQEVENNITQSSVIDIKKQCTSIDQNNNVVINVDDIEGDITIAQICTISGTDVIDNTLDAQVESIIESLQKQTNTTETGFLQFMVNANVSKLENRQSIRNNLMQTAANSCNNTISNIRQGSSYTITGAKLKGNINFIQQGDISSDCFITNVAKAVAYNKLKANQSQDNSISTGYGNIIAIVAIVVIVIIIGIVLFFFFTNKPGGGGGGTNIIDTRSPPSGPNPAQTEQLAQLAPLLL